MTAGSINTGGRRFGTAAAPRPADTLTPVAKAAPAKVESPREIAFSRLRNDRTFLISCAILATVIAMCLAAPLFEHGWAHRTYLQQNLSGTFHGKPVVSLKGIPNIAPGFHRSYMFGSDALGRDMFMRILKGGTASLEIGFASTIITITFGLLFGTISGYFGGWIDTVITQIGSIMLVLPSMILLIVLNVALAQSKGFLFFHTGSIPMLYVIMGVLGSAMFTRIVKSQAISITNREFVEAARALGANDTRIIFQHVIPQLTSIIVTYFGILFSGAILGEAAFSFLGIGVKSPQPSWGNLIADGQTYYSTGWWITFFPGLFIALTVVSVNLIGQSLEEAFDPKALGGR